MTKTNDPIDVYDLSGGLHPRHGHSLRVAYVGPTGSHADRALNRYVNRTGSSVEPIACRDILDSLLAVHSGEVDRAFVPWRNALGGSIQDSLDAVLELGLVIVGAELAPVRQCLAAAVAMPMHAIRNVASHPEALRQCRRLLRRIPGATRQPTNSTSAAARALASAREEGHERAQQDAVICDPNTAKRLQLVVLESDAADHPDNQTLFVMVARDGLTDLRLGADEEVPNLWRTALAVTTLHRAGALARCLSLLSEAGVQLTALESRPLVGRPWEIQFAMEAEGHAGSEALMSGLLAIREEVMHIRVLGSWQQGSEPQPQASKVAPPVAVSASLSSADKPVHGKVTKDVRLAVLTEGRARTIVRVKGVDIGGHPFVLIGGPCSVENKEQVDTVAAAVRNAGGRVLRGGAFKPRTSPYAFQGLGESGLELLAEAGRKHGLPVVTEVMRPEQVELCARHADMLQVGARNMQNFPLLSELGGCQRPILLKRGMSASLDELLAAAEYILVRGNTQVILCERGIRTFETATRSTLDLSAVPVLLERTHLPIIVDPSHAAGVRRWVPALAKAAKAVGAHGIIVEIHPNPEEALSDGPQALTLPMWEALARDLLA